ncbi:hypothetical protein ACFQZT_27155 [Paenibacillus sp. GCM10027628]|uniref:hypothetical protein n=1 Tax=Paenibacillus sp. GCM10027628 TaxID=3273413 RepID=UPI00362E3274
MDFFEVLCRMIVSGVSYYAIVVFIFSLFQVPLKKSHVFNGKNFYEDKIYDLKLTILVLALTFTNYYTKFVLQSPLFLLMTILVFVSLLVLIRRYPLFYAFIVVATGYIFIVTIDMLISFIGISLGLTTNERLTTNLADYTVVNGIYTLLLFAAAWFLRKRKVNLSFITKRFVGKYAFNRKNFIWATVLLVGITYLQVSWFALHIQSLYIWIFIGMVAILIVSLLHAYIRNKEHVQARYGAFESSSLALEEFLKHIDEAKKLNDSK